MRAALRNIIGHGIAVAAIAWSMAPAHAEPIRPLKTVNAWAQYTDRIIVRLKDEPATEKRQAMGAHRARALSTAAGTILIPHRPTGGQAQVMRLTHAMPLAEVERIAAKLAQDPSVLYAEPDRRKFPHATASDPRFAQQWYLFEQTGGINATFAWDVTTGASSVVVAFVDSGVVPSNPDLQGPRLLPGYDFISSDSSTQCVGATCPFATANDGDGRDSDPSDPGDWIDSNDLNNPLFTNQGCTKVEDSDWHGTEVANVFGAIPNSFGTVGVDWNALILPVRALGKCGGYDSDILDAARYAAGISVPGANGQMVTNPYPAKVINLSLGSHVSAGTCPEQNAIDEILGAGTVKAIITSAGNDMEDAKFNSPGNCRGVINVGATDRSGNLATYSDSGLAITLMAPGGVIGVTANDTPNGIIVTSDCGTTGPVTSAANCPAKYQPTTTPYLAFSSIGTSFAAPQVSGAVSLMLSVNPTLTRTQITGILQSTARAFPAGSTCTTSLCGAGILDVNAAVRTAAAMPGGSSAGGGGSGGGGGGGCALGDGSIDWALPLLMFASILGLARRRQKQK